MTLGTLFWLFVAGFAVWYWWRAKAIKDFVLHETYLKRIVLAMHLYEASARLGPMYIMMNLLLTVFYHRAFR